MRRAFHGRGRRIPGHQRATPHMSSAEIENLAIAHIEEWDHAPLEKVFSRAWKFLSTDGLVIGYSPLPDSSLIPSLYSANIVHKQLYGYFSKEIE
jgi:hypothetical protein